MSETAKGHPNAEQSVSPLIKKLVGYTSGLPI